jgi:hypothetical protein
MLEPIDKDTVISFFFLSCPQKSLVSSLSFFTWKQGNWVWELLGSHKVGGTSISVSRAFAKTIQFTGDTSKVTCTSKHWMFAHNNFSVCQVFDCIALLGWWGVFIWKQWAWVRPATHPGLYGKFPNKSPIILPKFPAYLVPFVEPPT